MLSKVALMQERCYDLLMENKSPMGVSKAQQKLN